MKFWKQGNNLKNSLKDGRDMPKCRLCPKSFQSEKDLESHLLKIHGISSFDVIDKKPITIGDLL